MLGSRPVGYDTIGLSFPVLSHRIVSYRSSEEPYAPVRCRRPLESSTQRYGLDMTSTMRLP